eukprot:COSAG06_NODE_13645_length_1235_cov_4.342430_3_plen_100_part_01
MNQCAGQLSHVDRTIQDWVPPTSSVTSISWPAWRARRSNLHHSPVAGGVTGTSVGGSATGAAAALAPPRVVRRLAGLSAGAAEVEGRLRLELEAAAALRV